MEFKFNVNDIFKQSIVEVNNNLIPPGFTGDRRALWDTLGKVSEIINAMGEASAAAQGLPKPITTAERLRNSEHKLYFLIDPAANSGKGAVTGMLKTGKKGLYVFDKEGQHYQVTPPCILDFYIHESRQRTGLGRQLFEYMLQKEEIEPVKMAIDRPSEKLLGFLNKHYTLNSPVKQMNNYVVFDGFFPKSETPNNDAEARKRKMDKKISYTEREKFLLAELVKDKGGLIENKKTDSASIHEKQKVWDSITRIYNAQPEVCCKRTSQQLKKLWSNLKQKRRKTNIEENYDQVYDPVLELVEIAMDVTHECKGDSAASYMEKSTFDEGVEESNSNSIYEEPIEVNDMPERSLRTTASFLQPLRKRERVVNENCDEECALRKKKIMEATEQQRELHNIRLAAAQAELEAATAKRELAKLELEFFKEKNKL